MQEIVIAFIVAFGLIYSSIGGMISLIQFISEQDSDMVKHYVLHVFNFGMIFIFTIFVLAHK